MAPQKNAEDTLSLKFMNFSTCFGYFFFYFFPAPRDLKFTSFDCIVTTTDSTIYILCRFYFGALLFFNHILSRLHFSINGLTSKIDETRTTTKTNGFAIAVRFE